MEPYKQIYTGFIVQKIHQVGGYLSMDRTQPAATVEGKCNVHDVDNYAKLSSVEDEDFFCRSEYNLASKRVSDVTKK